jgi:hypothetical protein
MGPHEINEIADYLDGMLATLATIPAGTITLEYGTSQTDSVREGLAKLRMRTGQLLAGFPSDYFPVTYRTIRNFSNYVDGLVRLFPGEVRALQIALNDLKTKWHIEVRPSIYALELALAITPGIYLPEDPNLFTGRDRYLRDITIEINTTYRNGAYNACSVLLRRLLETLIIKAHTRNGTAEMARKNDREYHHLGKLIEDVVANQSFGLTRGAYEAMPGLKLLGDWGAHNPSVLVRHSDLDPLKTKVRLCFEELLAKV